tara:strand:+ start:277 stop:618 length:342 start_codon:yes stop_codon:yes gene_type:complete
MDNTYTNAIIKDLECNYINAENTSAETMLLPCTNKPPQKHNVVEGFANDSSSGSQYIAPGSCGDGMTNSENGCVEVCQNCSTTMHLFEENKDLKKNNINIDHFNYIFTNTVPS